MTRAWNASLRPVIRQNFRNGSCTGSRARGWLLLHSNNQGTVRKQLADERFVRFGPRYELRAHCNLACTDGYTLTEEPPPRRHPSRPESSSNFCCHRSNLSRQSLGCGCLAYRSHTIGVNQFRKARTGSVCIARWAGTRDAVNETIIITKSADSNVAGSRGVDFIK